MQKVIENIRLVLKPGGLLLFRDYAVGDKAQERFETCGNDKKPLASTSDKCFIRRDNTLSYFFTSEEIDEIFDRSGYTRAQNEYVYRQCHNNKTGITLQRRFIQGRFIKN